MSENQAVSSGTPDPVSGGDDAEQEVVRLATRTDADGTSYTHAALTPASDTRSKEILADHRPIIPVIFLPGVMGTPLANKATGEPAFFAPNTDSIGSTIAALGSLIAGWFRSAASREKLFDPLSVAVTPLGPINVGDGHTITEEEARRRGWGSVHRTSYHPVLLWLEEQLNTPMLLGKAHGAWSDPDPTGKLWTLQPVLGTDPAHYGAYGKGEAITQGSAAFKRFAEFRYRVYAIGYNWLQSNDDSGRQVIEGSDYADPQTKKTTRLMGITEICKENDTGKAIVLTHSMGGLVARFAVASHGGESLMHGVFHGVQPATGAPLAGKRFKTGGGSEGGLAGFVNGSLMGRDADEFLAVTTNAPGPLELLPMPDYHNGAPWWIFARPDGQVLMRLPENGDAYNDLYLNSQWYGLHPDEKQLDPAGIVKERLDKDGHHETVLSNYQNTMKNVVARQNKLINRYHGKTYVAYANGGLKSTSKSGATTDAAETDKPAVEKGAPTKDLLTWGTAIWTGDLPSDVTEAELRAATLLHDSGKGDVRVFLEQRKLSVTFKVQKENKLPDDFDGNDASLEHSKNGIIPGDGTVPVWSADAQARGLKPGIPGDPAEGVQVAFVQGGYSHQGSYEHPWTRWAVLYSAVEIVKDVPVPGGA